MGLTVSNIKQAVTDLSLSETVVFAYGTESEANILADGIGEDNVFVWISPLTVNFSRNTSFTKTYTVGIFWGMLTDLDSIQEDSTTIFEKLEGYALRHVVKLQDNLVASGAIGRAGGIQGGSYTMDQFNEMDANWDGLFISFEVEVNEKVSC